MTPDVATRGRTTIIPTFEGGTIEWRAVSANAVNAYNDIHGTAWTTQSEEAAWEDDIVGWQGHFVVTYGMLGSSVRIEVS